MKSSLYAALALVCASVPAMAECDQPGSLLIFPVFDNARGDETFLTVTNTSATDTIDVEYLYIDGTSCLEFNRTRRLTPNDTIVVRTRMDNPNMVKGFAYVFAKSTTTGQPVSFNHLVGTSLINDGNTQSDYDVPAFTFKAVPAQGLPTDIDSDGVRELDGVEYQTAPDTLYIPRFIAQGPVPPASTGGALSDLVLINLTGGVEWQAIVDLMVYNDNEEAFSAQKTVRCWSRTPLTMISGVFTQSFLSGTNHNANESLMGAETGWYSLKGRLAYSSADSEANPAVLAMQIERRGNGFGATAVLPYATGSRDNGGLIYQGPFIW